MMSKNIILQTILVMAVFVVGMNQAQAYSTYKTIAQKTDGQDMTFSFTGLPPVASGTNAYVWVDLYGDYNSSNEFAKVWIEKIPQANHNGGSKQCNTTAYRRTYPISAANISDGTVTVRVDLEPTVNYSICKSYAPRVQVWLVYTSKPDLRVTSSLVPYIGGSTAKAGDYFKARYYIYNYYQYFSTNFYVRFYLCPTTSSSGCYYQGLQYITDNFSANQGRWYTSPTMSLSNYAQRGTQYIRIIADYSNSVSETSETNNDRYDSISVMAYPDLDFTASTVKYTGSTTGPGSKFTGRYTIKNDDSSSAVFTDFVVRYYYCTSISTSSCVSTPIGEQTLSTNFYSGYSYTYTSTTLTLPTSTTAGGRYVRAVLDATSKVSESDEKNNDDFNYIYVSTAQLPDLSVDQVQAPYSGSTAAAGSTFTVRSRVRNVSSNPLSTPFTVSYYLCPAQTTSGCTLLGSKAVNSSISANSHIFVTSSSLKMPNTAKLGTSYVRVFVDSADAVAEDSETNNNSYKDVKVTAKPDLIVAAKTVPKTGTASGPGDSFTAEFTITNKAYTSYFDTDFEVTYYYCTSASTSNCTVLATDTVSNNFSAGEAYTFTSSNLTIPGSATAGTRYIRAYVDSKPNITESSETNNNGYAKISITKLPPDLYVKSFTGADVGKAIKYSVEVCNSGEAFTTSFIISVFFNTTNKPTCSTTEDGQVTITGGLAKGACVKKTFTQPGVKPGNYMAWIMADQNCVVNEANEGNNAKSVSVTVATPPDTGVVDGPEIPADGGIDLVVTNPDQGGTPPADANQDGAKQDKGSSTQEQGATTQDQGTVTPPPVEGSCSMGQSPAPVGLVTPLLALVLGLLLRIRRRRS